MPFITDDTAAAQALANGEVQVDPAAARPRPANQLQGLSGVTTKVNGGFTFEHFDVNFQTPLFQDKAVRQALAHRVPRQDMVDKLIKPLDPNARSRTACSSRSSPPTRTPSGGQYDKVDIAKAEATLEAVGYTLNGRYEKAGEKVEFTS